MLLSPCECGCTDGVASPQAGEFKRDKEPRLRQGAGAGGSVFNGGGGDVKEGLPLAPYKDSAKDPS